jgi:hypothetical protein
LFATPSVTHEPLLPSQQTECAHPGNSPTHGPITAAGIARQRALPWIASAVDRQASKQPLPYSMMDCGYATGSVGRLQQETEAGTLLSVERHAWSWAEHAGPVPRPWVGHGSFSLAKAKAGRGSGTRLPCPTKGVAFRIQAGQDVVSQAHIMPLRGCSGPLRRALACTGSGLQRLLDRLFILYHRAALLQGPMR